MKLKKKGIANVAKCLTAGLLSAAMAAGMLPGSMMSKTVKAAASTHGNDIVLTKTAKDNGESAGNQTFDINLGVKGTEVTESAPLDVTLVIDLSNSMTNNSSPNLASTKAAATAFIEKMMQSKTGNNYANIANCKVRVSIVAYGRYSYAYNFTDGKFYDYKSLKTSSNISKNGFYTNNGKKAKSIINDNNFKPKGSLLTSANSSENGGTNTEGGLLASKCVTDTRSTNPNPYKADCSSYVLFMTDGVPTYRYEEKTTTTQGWPGHPGTTTVDPYGIGGDGSSTSYKDFNEAVTAAEALKVAGNVIYNIGLLYGVNDSNQDIANHLLSDEKTYTYGETWKKLEEWKPGAEWKNYGDGWSWYIKNTNVFSIKADISYAKKYFPITDGNATDDVVSIYSEIANEIKALATGTVTDIIPAGFELTAASKENLIAQGCTVTENSNGSTTIVFPNVSAAKDKQNLPTYTIKYTGNGMGVGYTNSSATFNYTDYEGNTGSKDFPKPVGALCPQTSEDTKVTKVNQATTINVRDNDAFTNLTVDGYTVNDYEIVITDKDGNPISYTTANNGFTVGNVNSANGTVQFTSPNESDGYEFYYVVKAKISKTDANYATNGRSEVVSKPTKVTVKVVNAQDKSFVIDYYKPVTYDKSQVFTSTELASGNTVSLTNNTGTYGIMDLNSDKSITYTLNKVMKNVDKYSFAEKISGLDFTKTVTMIPATSVYYNDSFYNGNKSNNKTVQDGITYSSGWTTVGTDNQKFQDSAQGSSANYGHDSSEEIVGNSGGVAHKASKGRATADKLTFTFKGTGIDLYSTTNTSSGQVVAQISKDGDVEDTRTVQTSYKTSTLYNMPTVSFKDLEYGEYTLDVYVDEDTEFEFDGLRVYNPTDNAEATQQYTKDEEGNAQVVYVRDALVNDGEVNKGLVTKAVGELFIDDYEDLNGDTVKGHNVTLDSTETTTDDYAEYQEFGPKFAETYLAAGKTLTLTVKDGYNVQLGVKASVLNGAKYTINGGTDTAVKSSADMYYKVSVNSNNQIVIKNTGSVMLELTGIKFVPKN